MRIKPSQTSIGIIGLLLFVAIVILFGNNWTAAIFVTLIVVAYSLSLWWTVHGDKWPWEKKP